MSKYSLSKIERSKIDDHPIYGVVIQETNKLIVLHREIDFAFDGILVVRKKDVSQYIKGTKRELRYEKIMRQEGLWKSPSRLSKALPATDWQVLLQSLIGMPILLEDEKNSVSWIGVVRSCGGRDLTLQCFDALGVYDKKLSRIPYASITSALFGDRYTSLQFKYADRE